MVITTFLIIGLNIKMAKFEIRLIRALWVKKDVLLKIETAKDPIILQSEGGSDFSADIPAYPQIATHCQGQIGVSVCDLSVTTKLVQADGTEFEFSPLKDSDGRIWWVEKDEWKEQSNGSGYYDAPLCRHAGQASLKIGNSFVSLNISPPGFSETEFEILLDEFRNGMWQLILDAESHVTATNHNVNCGLNKEFWEAVREHLKYVNNILNQPHCELREIQEQQQLIRVRPITKTFQEIALRGDPRTVTGRGHAPSYNTPENQQLSTMTYRLLRAMQGLYRAAKGAADGFKIRTQESLSRLNSIKASEGYIKIDSQ